MAGETVTIDSNIVMKETFPAFHGKVVSDNSDCDDGPGREAVPQDAGGGREKLGKTTSSAAGRWKILVDPLSSGAYYSKLKQRTEGTAGTIYVCTGDKSQVAEVD